MEDLDAAADAPLQFKASNQTNSEPGIILRGNHTPPAEFGVETLQLSEGIIRHRTWADMRARTWAAMLKSGLSTMRLERFAECGSGLWVLHRRCDGALRMSCNCCRDRWCQPCATSRGRRLADALLKQIEDVGTVRFITLTLRHRPGPLKDSLDRLYACFARLRRRELWGECVTGCAAVCELKIGRDGLWHPHLHILAAGTYIDQRALSREWLAVTGDSSIVDIRAVTNARSLAFYVTKYASKGCDQSVWKDPERLLEAIVTMRGRRLCMTCGSWRGVKLLPPDEDAELDERDDEGRPLHEEDARRWVPLHRVDLLFKRAKSDRVCFQLWCEFAARWPSLAQLYDPGGILRGR